MGHEQASPYYDYVYRMSARYAKEAVDSPWGRLWTNLARRIGGDSVVDLGCGPGHLACLLDGEYTGIDFSTVAVDQAYKRNAERVPRPVFKVLDLTQTLNLPDADTYVASEVLEHIEDDKYVLSLIPVGKRVIISVPNHDSKGHVRYFHNLGHAVRRYRTHITITDTERLDGWFIIEGYRNDRGHQEGSGTSRAHG